MYQIYYNVNCMYYHNKYCIRKNNNNNSVISIKF